MTLTPQEQRRGEQFIKALPGKRGVDIPTNIHDTITSVGNGITRPLWGRDLEPHQIQWLFDNGAHTPDAIHAAVGALPHPHAPQVSVNDYQKYASAHKVFTEHTKQQQGKR